MDKIDTLYNTDKCSWCHNYTQKYNELFNKIRFNNLKILEIGIGSIELPSLKLWKDYFPNSIIYGLDVEKDYIINTEDRIHTYLCNTLDKQDVDKIIKPLGFFDIIIDDGCHRCDGQQITFCNFFKYLSTNGIYIIEDCGSSFNTNYNFGNDIDCKNKSYQIGPPNKRINIDMPEFIYSNIDKNRIDTTYNVFMNFNKIKKINSFYIENYISNTEKESLEKQIKNIEYWQGNNNTDSLIIIYSN